MTVEEENLCKASTSPTNDGESCDEAPGFVSHMLTFISLLIICLTFPLSLCWVVKVRPRVTCHVSLVVLQKVPSEGS